LNAMNFEAVKVAIKQDKTGYILTLSVHPDEVPEDLLRDFVGARYGVAMVRINSDESPEERPNRVSKAMKLCKISTFWDHLGVADNADAMIRLCALCEIDSLSELNGTKTAQRKFDAIVREYEESDPFK
jgi:hypothetical protein